MSTTNQINEGYSPIFETTLTVKIMNDETQEKIFKEEILQILIKQNDESLESVRFQLYDETQLDFLFESSYFEEDFQKMKEKQDLEIDFMDFPNVIRQLLNKINIDSKSAAISQYKISLTNIDDNEDEEETYDSNERKFFLKISQRLEFCTVELFKIVLSECTPDRIEKVAQYRYNQLAQKLKAIQIEYNDFYKRVQRQSPKALVDFKQP
ncbi:hypothetical protein GPJ56_000292 [Histomonas meleagridis]|uniref:uncharacterized protein n=1 Tax=Histomonas meleagridis TaxID=135588 RepID=UPI00355A0DCD|nr:hypothetical protein GPJ56_000292 [Histomonas meleagridis]KAH0806810.1 hypothetical protein GO595_000453 [Histomonas meleagridis]